MCFETANMHANKQLVNRIVIPNIQEHLNKLECRGKFHLF